MAPVFVWKTPFQREEQLDDHLQLIDSGNGDPIILMRADTLANSSLPGNPFVGLQLQEILRHLHDTLETPELNVFAAYLWLVSTQSSSSVTPLHQQIVLGRNVIITQSAHLHLIWYHDRVFIKPLPCYLLSYAFWTFLSDRTHARMSASKQEAVYQAAVGFIRTYCHLVKDETDFRMAVKLQLIPDGITLEAFATFIQTFKNILDDSVAPRFCYGELRLSRLNFWAPLVLHRLEYFNTTRQSDLYFSRYFQPLLFAFGTFSVLLSAMQLALAVETLPETQGSWSSFTAVCRWSAVVSIIIIAVIAVSMLVLFLFRILNELAFALMTSQRRIWAEKEESLL